MGAISPHPSATDAVMADVEKTILLPIIEAMAKEGHPLRGALYVNLILAETGPTVVEFQVRFNDPATQVVLPRLKEDLVTVMEAVLDGATEGMRIAA